MFPNFRLIIVAMMASILGISCGLAVFAAFHVNRDPILLSTSGAPPLLFSNAAPITPNGPGRKTAEPFDTHFTISLPPAPVASPERPLRSFALAPDPTSQVDSVMARSAEPPDSANSEAAADIASTEETKAESRTADAAKTELTDAETTTAEAGSPHITKAEANTELDKTEEIKPDGASKLSSGDSNTVPPTIVSIIETSAGEQSSPTSVNGEKTVRPASAKFRVKTVKGKVRAKTGSAKVRAKATRTRATHTKPLRARPGRVVQFADQTFAAQPMYQWPTQPTKAVIIRRGRHGRSR